MSRRRQITPRRYSAPIDPLEPRQLFSTIYVDASSPSGAPDGTSWATAYIDLQQALSVATSGDTIQVADGTYKPTSTTDRTISFNLKSGVAIYGGYAGYGATNPNARDISAYPTILSGDIATVGQKTDNSYHVVTGSGTNTTAILDGFTITAGYASGSGTNQRFGGGMLNVSGSPTLTNCTLTANTAVYAGGGIYNVSNSSPKLTDCTFTGNTAVSSSSGGGMANYSSSPSLANCTFTGNSASSGGGMANYSSSPSLANCTFTGNSASYGGGGMANDSSSPSMTNCTFTGNSASTGGGMANSSPSPTKSSSPSLINCTFSGNSASNGNGGGMNNEYYCSPTLTQCTFTGNSASSGNGGGMYNYYSSSPTLTNCTFADNSASNRDGGGGMCNTSSSSPSLFNCTFTGNSAPFHYGGGMYNSSSSPSMTNCTFTGNSANWGGGMYNYSSSPTLTNCTLTGNSATIVSSGTSASSAGGGMYNTFSSPTLNNCAFTRNSANATSNYTNSTSSGGGMYNGVSSSPTLNNCTFSGNSANATSNSRLDANSSAAASSYGGGMYNGSSSSPTLNNCAFTGNSATSYFSAWASSSYANNTSSSYGGGMYNGSSSPKLTNCTFSGNSVTATVGGATIATAFSYGGGMYNISSSPKLTNCILWGNSASTAGSQIYNSSSTPVITYSDIQGGYTGTGNINTDPLFVRNPSRGPDNKWGTADDDYGDLRLRPNSPAVNTGSNTAIPSGTTTDLAGHPRIAGSAVDMGAYEYILPGDANLNGRIDPDDYALLDRAFARQTPNPQWTDGDFDYSGSLDAIDYLLLDLSAAAAATPSPALLAIREATFGPGYVDALLESLPSSPSPSTYTNASSSVIAAPTFSSQFITEAEAKSLPLSFRPSIPLPAFVSSPSTEDSVDSSLAVDILYEPIQL